ncbi:MAG: MaoC family dehydratase N-terminal domain-containing protein [Candidatus Rokubacteria bacterium]|nr:MaoC family dehydratase N-terminal domain-containing protein [Candidatus Rokubacteria bacterium]
MSELRISRTIVGTEAGPLAHPIDARWLMAYAAGLGEQDGRYYDTLRPGGPVAHPLFSVCYEWPLALELRAKALEADVAPRGVHATHHVVIHRPPRAGDTLLTSACIAAIARRRSGTLVTTRFTTVDERGAPVTTTDHGSIYRGVDCDEEASVGHPSVGAWTTRRGHRADAPADTPGTGQVRWTDAVPVAAGAAHVYTECARIWNPIHTDIAVAKSVGLPGLILHGTATLALAVSRVVARDLDGDAAPVREIAGRFTGMVLMPSTFTVRGLSTFPDGRIAFDAMDAEGGAALGDAWIAGRGR